MIDLRTALVSTALVVASCARRAPPALEPEAPQPSPVAAPRASLREGVGPDAAVQSAPSPTSAPQSGSSCAQTEPETDPSAGLGLRPRVVQQGRDQAPRFDRADVFLRTRARPMAPGVASGGLSLELRGPRVVRRDQPIALQVAFRNQRASSITVVRTNDGSYEHMREPYIDLYVEDVSTQQVYRGTFVGGRCGMVNALTAQDLVTIAAGASSEAPAGDWSRHLRESKIPAAGRYRVWTVYRMCDLASAQGMGQRFALPSTDVFVGRASSNAIEIQVQ